MAVIYPITLGLFRLSHILRAYVYPMSSAYPQCTLSGTFTLLEVSSITISFWVQGDNSQPYCGDKNDSYRPLVQLTLFWEHVFLMRNHHGRETQVQYVWEWDLVGVNHVCLDAAASAVGVPLFTIAKFSLFFLQSRSVNRLQRLLIWPDVGVSFHLR